MKTQKKKLCISTILFLTILMVVGQTVFAQYIPPVTDGYTRYNRDYYDKMIAEGKPTQESPWGFQELYIGGAVQNNVSSIAEYIALYNSNVSGGVWADGKTHIVNFAAGTYVIPYGSYYVMMVPSKTIIKGAGMGQTIFQATAEKTTETALFAVDNCDDVVLRDFSFYNVTKDNKWFIVRGTDWGSARRENFLFENIEFDDTFGPFGVGSGCQYNFVTFRGLRKRIGNTTARIKANYSTPVPSNYQFRLSNAQNIHLSGQIGMRIGNSVVFHDCIVGDNISATLDIYNNYVEIVGVSFVDPLHDHSIKAPSGNHIYVHDSQFELTYTDKIMDNSYYNPTFFTHEGGVLSNYHFKNMSFTRAGLIRNAGALLVESEPFTLYDNRYNNRSGDVVWENIQFSGYGNQVVGFSNVQTGLGFQAINYTGFTARAAQLKSGQVADFSVAIQNRSGNSKTEVTGVYSWGQRTNGTIDFPRDNRTFEGSKSQMESQPYVQMYNATVKDIYNARLSGATPPPSNDTQAPVITLIGANPMDLIINETYNEPGATVTDNVDVGLIATITGSVNTSVAGTYYIYYNAVDNSGNNATEVTRTVNVTEGLDTSSPVITLNGTNPMNLAVGDTYNEPGATVTDNVDVGLTATIAGSVNTSIAGTYYVNYNAVDNAGNNAIEVTRTINVAEESTTTLTANAGPDITHNVTASNTSIYLQGSVTPVDAVIVYYKWYNETTGEYIGEGQARWYYITASGIYTIRLEATDVYSNIAIDYKIVTVDNPADGGLGTDTEAPVITLNGANPLYLTIGDTYNEPGATVTDNVDAGLTATITGSVNTSVAETYYVNYNTVDNAGNNAVEVTRTVNVNAGSDTEAPVITLNGANPMNLTVGDPYNEQGATVTDNVDAGLTATITGSVNTSVAGTYYVNYNAVDNAGNNAAEVTRTVNVNEGSDIEAPIITLNGSNPINLTVGDTYNEAGATVTDNVDVGLTATITGSVNTSVAGIYYVNYNAVDNAGNNATEVIRTVNVDEGSTTTLTADAGYDVTHNVTPSNTAIFLQGSVTPEGTSISYYKWYNETTGQYIGDGQARWYYITASGIYTIKLEVMDVDGNTATDTKIVSVDNPADGGLGTGTDTQAPVINLNGANPMNLTVGDTYNEQGATVTDNVDAGLTATITGSVNTSVAGTYYVNYNAVDNAGNNAAEVTRTVNVNEGSDIQAPLITLNGANPMNLTVGDTYNEPGATVTDNVDVGLTATITGSVNTSIAGIYYVNYNAVDNAGNNATEVTRTVNVNEGSTTTLTANAGPDVTHNVTPSVTSIFLQGSVTPEGTSISYYKWYNETTGQYIGDGQARWYYIVTAGTYTIKLEVMDVNGNIATDTKEVYVVNESSTKSGTMDTGGNTVSSDIIEENSLSVYPNPTNEVINVKSSMKISSIVVVNALEQEVIRINNPSDEITKINAQHIKSGMYFIKVIYENGKISTKKIIKR